MKVETQQAIQVGETQLLKVPAFKALSMFKVIAFVFRSSDPEDPNFEQRESTRILNEAAAARERASN